MIKYLLLAGIILTFYLRIDAQEIVDPNKLWSSMEEHCQPWGSTYSTDYFQFNMDTVINDTVYKKVWISEDEEHQNWDFYGAFIREENKRVYYRQAMGEEGLLYDFTLTIGDSVIVDNPRAVDKITLYLDAIDSIPAVDGYRERWRLIANEYPNYEYWIRGIGSETGVINSSSGIFGGLCGLYTLLCQKYDSELVYLNPEYETCYMYITGSDELEVSNNQFLLCYNEASKTVHIEMLDIGNKEVILSSIAGKIVDRVQTSSENISFSINDNPLGIYFISVNQNDILFTQKFIAY